MLHITLFAKKAVKDIKALFFLTCWLEQRETDRKLLIPNWEPLANNRSSLRIPICHFVHLGIVQTGHLASCGHLYYFDFRCHFHVHDIPLFEQQCLVSAGASPIHSGINVDISESCGYRKGPVLDPGASQNLNFKELLEATCLPWKNGKFVTFFALIVMHIIHRRTKRCFLYEVFSGSLNSL